MSITKTYSPKAEVSEPWRFSTRSLAIRLFFTCWLIYSLHLATNTVREIYLALAIGDHLSFRVTDYAHMHPDLFEKKGYGWHIGANPGASMLAAIPYAVSRPIVDRIVARVNRQRAAGGQEPPAYNSPWPMSRQFFEEAWRRGLDVKFGLAAIIMQTLCMAPVSAFGVVAMFFLLRHIFFSDRTAFWLSILYAFGTPVFFRTGYLNHNLMLGHFALMGFMALWNPGGILPWKERTRYFAGGVAGGAALLFDYSGVVLLGTLFAYGVLRKWRFSWGDRIRAGSWYVAASLLPIGLLWFYQWQSFGNPFYPGQHWMPPVEWIELGYQGFTLPRPDIFRMLLFDYRFGLFVTCPLFLLALASPWVKRDRERLPNLELAFLLVSAAAFILFCSGISYTRLQYNTGIRYLAGIFPVLFVPVAIVLMKIRPRAGFCLALFSIAENWAFAMYRDVERGMGVLDPILQVYLGGFKLPLLTVLSRLTQFQDVFSAGASPAPLFLLTAGLLFAIWSKRLPHESTPTIEAAKAYTASKRSSA